MSQPITPNAASAIPQADQLALKADAARSLAAALALAALPAVALGAAGGLGTDFSFKVLMLFGVLSWLVWRGMFTPEGAPHPHGRFGGANRVTLFRLGVCALLASLLGESLPQQAWWAVVVLATATALLDAVDGPLARRSGLASSFGARFDMETDAFFTLVLCALVWQADKTGGWVLASGLMRYVFVAAAYVWPRLNAALPPSRRRQAVCVVQITALIVCLGPIVPPLLASALAAISLALLTLSFAIDIRFLYRAPSTET
jgi:phosphatidylglycerophosphate synthase